MKIRISRVTGYRDAISRFNVEVEQMQRPIIQDVVLINGIQFTNNQDEKLTWVLCEDRTILEQISKGGIDKWFSKQMSVITSLVIETDKLGRVVKAHSRVKDMHYHTLFDNGHNPHKSISQVIQLLCSD